MDVSVNNRKIGLSLVFLPIIGNIFLHFRWVFMRFRLLFLGSLFSIGAIASAMEKAPSLPIPPQSSHTIIVRENCEEVLPVFNQKYLQGKINVSQLIDIIRTLNRTQRLPSYFVTKKEARRLGWKPGVYFQRIPALQGKSIGGDFFGNYEQRLPSGQWQEADLDYRGYKRNAKRLVFSHNGERYVTIDHYQHFYPVPSCQ